MITMKDKTSVTRIICAAVDTVLVLLTANIVLLSLHWFIKVLITLAFILVNVFPDLHMKRDIPKRLKRCDSGAMLLIAFLVSLLPTVGAHIALLIRSAHSISLTLIWSICIAAVVEVLTFWNGIVRVYCTSTQLGISTRIWGAVCGWIPVANIVMLIKIIRLTWCEVGFEMMRISRNSNRSGDCICKTKYPILLVHGVFFRDTRLLNYWGRIPAELEKNGAKIYYGGQDSAASVAKSGRDLGEKIQRIVRETGCEKVNIIAHSKGGLDSRYAISKCGAGEYVASLTTINTPHHGCLFADYLLEKIPVKMQNDIAKAYNSALSRLGDTDPDFMAAVTDLTAKRCEELNAEMPDMDGVYYAAVGSELKNRKGGKFPLNYTYKLAEYFDGPNDGLVSTDSCKRGGNFTILEPTGRRGISHGDMIDLNRENIRGFDVREFYVDLVSKLKEKGL